MLTAGLCVFISCLAVYVLYVRKLISAGFLAGLVILMTSAELIAYGSIFYPRCDPVNIFPETLSLKYLRENSGDHRIVSKGADKVSEPLWPNTAHPYGLKSVNYYSAFVCERFHILLSGMKQKLSTDGKFEYSYVHGVN
ncbi:hypothetical protein ACFLQ8_03625, partial [Candidatus Auribacterota bacterium]